MLAVKQAVNLIKQASIPGLDEVYGFNIPKEQVGNVDETIIRVSDVSTRLGLWGSNDFHTLNREIEVQIFYKQDLDFDPEQTETALYRLFIHNDWVMGENRGHTIDPDTQQLTSTFYVSNEELTND